MGHHGACDAGGRGLIPPRLTLAPAERPGAFSCPNPPPEPIPGIACRYRRPGAPRAPGTRPAPRPPYRHPRPRRPVIPKRISGSSLPRRFHFLRFLSLQKCQNVQSFQSFQNVQNIQNVQYKLNACSGGAPPPPASSRNGFRDHALRYPCGAVLLNYRNSGI